MAGKFDDGVAWGKLLSVHAAMMAGVKSVPAMIVPISPTEQARAFIQVNSARISMSQFNLFKAGLTANEPWALAANKAVMDAVNKR